MKRILSALILSAGTALAAPALAGGSVSFASNPTTADDARALALGLALYGVANDIRSNGHITQRGARNIAGLAQSGRGHYGVIHQDGRGHDASLTQRGAGNSYGIFQFGRGASGHVTQNGYGQSGVLIQYGW